MGLVQRYQQYHSKEYETMKISKSIIKTEVIYDDEMKNKYVVKKEWDKAKRKALT